MVRSGVGIIGIVSLISCPGTCVWSFLTSLCVPCHRSPVLWRIADSHPEVPAWMRGWARWVSIS
jgi:hypothetical protein